jgi:hypothetical protein
MAEGPHFFPTDEFRQPLLTRRAVARLLKCDVSSVRRYEAKGELRPFVLRGQHFFRRDEVLTLVERREPIAAKAFELFRAGKGIVEAVCELQGEPGYMRELHDEYQRAQRRLIVELPESVEHWARAYHADLRDFTPVRLLRALEICLANPSLRAQLDALSNAG